MPNIKKYDYLINDNGDIWMVERVHRDGAVTISSGVVTGEDVLTYSAGEIESFFRKLPKSDYTDVDWLDPKPFWSPQAPVKAVRRVKRSGKAKRGVAGTTISGIGR